MSFVQQVMDPRIFPNFLDFHGPIALRALGHKRKESSIPSLTRYHFTKYYLTNTQVRMFAHRYSANEEVIYTPNASNKENTTFLNAMYFIFLIKQIYARVNRPLSCKILYYKRSLHYL